jgi:signal transduction histidine kinase
MLVFWNLNFFVLYSVPDYQLASSLAHFFRVGSLFLPAAILHLSLVLTGRPVRGLRLVTLWIDYLVAFLLTLVNALDLFVLELRHFAWGYYSVGTAFYDLFSIFVVVNFACAASLMLFDYTRTTDPRMRLQFKFWLLGVAVGLPLGVTHLLPAYGVPFYPLGNLGSAAWAAIVGYAIVRHRLMDIDIVLTRGIAYVGAAVVVIGPTLAATIGLQSWAFGVVHSDFTATMLLLLLVVCVLFPGLQQQAERRLQKALFRRKYEERAAFAAFTKSVVRILDRDKLVRELCMTVRSLFGLEGIALFLKDPDKTHFQLTGSLGTGTVHSRVDADHPFSLWVAQQPGPTMHSELPDPRTDIHAADIRDLWETNRWEVCVPLVSRRLLLGFIALGRKLGLDAYSAGDLQLLGALADESSIALENATLYEQLRKSHDVIQRAGRLSALGTLAAGIAHEIRNPLVSIQTFFQLAPHRIHDEEFLTSFLSLTESEVKRICDLITELLTFAKSPTPSLREVDVGDEISRTLTLILPQARTRHVELTTTVNGSIPTVLVDPDQLRQVMLNVILNAIEATANEGAVHVALSETTHQDKRYCQIDISDDGHGMSTETVDNIFNPFFTTKTKGTGLGLSICHQIVTEHGGFIEVSSKVGDGSCFSIYLPTAHEARRAAITHESPPPALA